MSRVLLVFLLAFSFTIPVFAQSVDTAWVRRYDGPTNQHDNARAIAVDNSGNVYVTGDGSDGGTSCDYITIKYYPDGDTAWIQRYAGVLPPVIVPLFKLVLPW
jgi:hypothetical protein